MNEIKKQVGLIRRVKFIRSQYQSIRLSGLHYRFLANFFKKNRWFILVLIILLLTQGLLEALLIIFSRNQLSTQQNILLAPIFWQFLAMILVFFFINSFFSIRQEKTLGVWLANSIRHRLFWTYLDRPFNKMSQDQKSDLIAKISYQLPLTSMGLTNSVFGLVRWLIYVVVSVLIAAWGGLSWGVIILAMIVLSLIIAVAAYFVARHYISQEVTYYSQIIREVDASASEKCFLKNFNQEGTATKRFDRLVDFDSFFRVRRDLWMRLGFKIVFALLIVAAVLTRFFSPEFMAMINLSGPEQKFLFLFLMIYFSRSLNEALKVGLYYFPARLGLFLTITKIGGVHRRKNQLKINQSLNFSSQKTKIYKAGPYHRRLNFDFLPGGRYLFYGLGLVGKTALAKLFAGEAAYNPKAIKIKLDGRRLDYVEWQKFGKGLCWLDPNFRSQKTIMEFILGQSSDASDFSEIEAALSVLAKHDSIAKMISPNGNYNSSVEPVLANNLSAFALWAIHSLVNKPKLVVVDNFWLDLNYPEIIKIIQLLNTNLPQTTFLIFSRANNNYLNYQQKYVMAETIAAK